jgi:BirA family biotin operon repressor/biotin-[acetyl-CoA-carboxylase] ligase
MIGIMAGATLVQRVFELLADGELHAGSELALALGVSRTAIWKAVSGLRTLGVAIDSVPRQGYRAVHAYTPLTEQLIAERLPAPNGLRQGAVLWSTTSTNALLLAQPGPEPGRFDYRIAEYQTAGRGRRGRRWLAPPGGALCLSLSWSYAALPPDVGALSLAVGVGIWRVMRRFGLLAPRLKWPNDVLLGTRKLCGVLLELRAEMAGPALVVVGIGLNCRLEAASRGQVSDSGTEPADLFDAGALRVDRNQWAAALIAETVVTLQTFGESGFASFTADWHAADALTGAAIVVRGAQLEIQGIAEGIDGDGALRVHTATGLQRFTSGDVSVRSKA